MAKARKQITGWVVEALTELGGSASFLDISKYVWEHHEDDIRAIDDLLYEWQYELRWSAYFLRPRGVWELSAVIA